MTRINVVPPSELSGKHLVAEYRELPRVFGLVRAAIERGMTPIDIDAPTEYVLGTGHVKFFYTRLLWLSWRHVYLVNEMATRGYNPRFKENLRVTHQDIPQEWWDDYQPTESALAVNRARIKERTK